MTRALLATFAVASFASSAIASPVNSPAKTTPPAVGVTPATTGIDDRYFQRTEPLSASIAEIQPWLFSNGSLSPKPFAAPENAPPARPPGLSAGSAITVEHQSTAPTKSRLSDRSNAGPFHSDPPVVPGQKRTGRPGTSGAAMFSRVVVGVCQRSFIGDRSIADKSPSLLADATICRPPRVVSRTGPASTSQSGVSALTSCM